MTDPIHPCDWRILQSDKCSHGAILEKIHEATLWLSVACLLFELFVVFLRYFVFKRKVLQPKPPFRFYIFYPNEVLFIGAVIFLSVRVSLTTIILYAPTSVFPLSFRLFLMDFMWCCGYVCCIYYMIGLVSAVPLRLRNAQTKLVRAVPHLHRGAAFLMIWCLVQSTFFSIVGYYLDFDERTADILESALYFSWIASNSIVCLSTMYFGRLLVNVISSSIKFMKDQKADNFRIIHDLQHTRIQIIVSIMLVLLVIPSTALTIGILAIARHVVWSITPFSLALGSIYNLVPPCLIFPHACTFLTKDLIVLWRTGRIAGEDDTSDSMSIEKMKSSLEILPQA